jgi:hypothetical protein
MLPLIAIQPLMSYNMICRLFYAPVAQWIEHWIPVPGAGVRFPSGAPYITFRSETYKVL